MLDYPSVVGFLFLEDPDGSSPARFEDVRILEICIVKGYRGITSKSYWCLTIIEEISVG